MVISDRCTCTETTHAHHTGGNCDRPAISNAEEVQDGPDTTIGALCLECYQEKAVELHEEDPSAVLDLNVAPSFPLCESPRL